MDPRQKFINLAVGMNADDSGDDVSEIGLGQGLVPTLMQIRSAFEGPESSSWTMMGALGYWGALSGFEMPHL